MSACTALFEDRGIVIGHCYNDACSAAAPRQDERSLKVTYGRKYSSTVRPTAEAISQCRETMAFTVFDTNVTSALRLRVRPLGSFNICISCLEYDTASKVDEKDHNRLGSQLFYRRRQSKRNDGMMQKPHRWNVRAGDNFCCSFSLVFKMID